MEPADMEQLIRATYARWSRGDQSFDPETMHPEIEIRSVAGMLTGRTYRGREGVEQWTSDVNESFDQWTGWGAPDAPGGVRQPHRRRTRGRRGVNEARPLMPVGEPTRRHAPRGW